MSSNAIQLNKQCKYWCFTLNNYTPEEVGLLKSMPPPVSYMLFGFEEAPSTGTPHLQGYLELSRKLRGREVIQLAGLDRASVFSRIKPQAANVTYCKKSGNFVELGELRVSRQGKRTDLDDVKLAIESGQSELQIAESHFSQWVYHRRSFARYRELVTVRRIRTDLKVIVLHGATGTGKTRFVHEQFPDVEAIGDPTLTWFDGYNGGPVALIDEFRGKAPCELLLKVFDIYPLRVPVKGGWIDWRPNIIFVTCNPPPPWSYSDVYSEIAPLMRRIHVVFKVTKDTTKADIESACGFTDE